MIIITATKYKVKCVVAIVASQGLKSTESKNKKFTSKIQ